MRLRPRKKPQGNFLAAFTFLGGYFVGFIKSYKHLDNLCKDINGIGVTGYINDMEDRPSAEYRIAGWKQDYLKLKHYRYIRNQIAHENYAEEENMSSPEDTVWLDNFYNRIMNQTDPLALYYQATKPRTIQRPPKMQNQPQIYHTSTNNTYNQTYKHNKKTSHKPVGCITFIVCALLIAVAMIYFLK